MTIATKIKTMPKYLSRTLITIISLLIVLRLFLPAIIKHYLNDYLENDMESYVGHVEDVDLSLWRGAYQLQDFYLKKKILKGTEPFIAFEEADISLSWKALIKRQIRVDLTLKTPVINFTDSKDKKKDQLGAQDEKASWKTITDKFYLLTLPV